MSQQGGLGLTGKPGDVLLCVSQWSKGQRRHQMEKNHKASSRSKPLSQSVESCYSPSKHHMSSTVPASVHESALAELYVSPSQLTSLRPSARVQGSDRKPQHTTRSVLVWFLSVESPQIELSNAMWSSPIHAQRQWGILHPLSFHVLVLAGHPSTASGKHSFTFLSQQDAIT